MTTPKELREEFATEIFIRELKRQWFRQHPSANPEDCPVGMLFEYPRPQQIALIRAVAAAAAAMHGSPEMFLKWLQLKTGETSPASPV